MARGIQQDEKWRRQTHVESPSNLVYAQGECLQRRILEKKKMAAMYSSMPVVVCACAGFYSGTVTVKFTFANVFCRKTIVRLSENGR